MGCLNYKGRQGKQTSNPIAEIRGKLKQGAQHTRMCVYIYIKLQWSLFISRGAIHVAYAHAYHYRVLRS
jgi:hypothetical protein